MPTKRPTFEHLRLVRASALREYFENTQLWARVGNNAFAEEIARAPRSLRDPSAPAMDKPYVLYHAWLPDSVRLTEAQARQVRRLIRGDRAADPQSPLAESIAALGWCVPGEPSIPSLVERTRDTFVAIQNELELARFLRVVKRQRPRVVVEIGSARGGTLFCLAQLADPQALLVSIDLPGAPNCGGQTEVERKLFRSFAGPRQRMAFLPKDSHLASTRRALQRVLGGRRIDLLFLDGDHSYDGVRSDFESYAPLVGERGLVVLHDITMQPEQWGPASAVGRFWQEVKRSHRCREIVDPDGVTTIERPPDRRWAWGFGIVSGARAGRRAGGGRTAQRARRATRR